MYLFRERKFTVLGGHFNMYTVHSSVLVILFKLINIRLSGHFSDCKLHADNFINTVMLSMWLKVYKLPANDMYADNNWRSYRV